MPTVTEALLEIHFTQAFARLLESTFGAAPMKFWKPSASVEASVGFDQGWYKLDYNAQHQNRVACQLKFENDLRTAIRDNRPAIEHFYVGYFLQYKLPKRMNKRSKYTPQGVRGRHFRAKVDTRKNDTTGRSQHETLVRLSQIRGADVNYACGMLFDSSAIYNDSDIDLLRFVPVDDEVAKASKSWDYDSSHFIVFQNITSDPIWCSDPMPGKARKAREWASSLKRRSPSDVLEMISSARQTLELHDSQPPPFWTVWEFDAATTNRSLRFG